MRASAGVNSIGTASSTGRLAIGVTPIAAVSRRRRLFDSSIGLVETLTCISGNRAAAGEGFSSDFQVCLPYRGLFVWHVGSDDVVGDANQVLFVTGGETYRLTEPVPGGTELDPHAESGDSRRDRSQAQSGRPPALPATKPPR